MLRCWSLAGDGAAGHGLGSADAGGRWDPASFTPVESCILNADALAIRGYLAHLDTFGYSSLATTARKIATLRAASTSGCSAAPWCRPTPCS